MNNKSLQIVSIQNKNSGFYLIEILITLVVLSLGLLGLGGLQLLSVKSSNESHFRNEASLLLTDLANRARSNAQGTNDHFNTINETTITVNCSTTVTACDGSSACDATSLAEYDLNQIACNAKSLLPSGKLEITKIADPVTQCALGLGITAPYYMIDLSWVVLAKKGVDNSANQKSVELSCFTP